jgi:hypothetical protein
MSESRVTEWMENDRVCLWVGATAALISVVIVPLFGLLAIFCGYKLYDRKTLPGLVIAGIGAVGFVSWLYYLATL